MKQPRKKVNFMLNTPLIQEMQLYIPARERSDFVNSALEEAFLRKKREISTQKMREMRDRLQLKISPEEIRKLRHEGLL